MSEEIKNDVQSIPVETPVETTINIKDVPTSLSVLGTQHEESSSSIESQYSDIEKDAISKGWDPKGRKSAEHWLETGELIGTIKSLQEQQQETKRAIKDLVEHKQKVIEETWKQTREEIRRQQREAASVADVDRVQELGNQLEQMSEQAPVRKPQIDEETRNSIINAGNEFRARNTWFNEYATDPDSQSMTFTAKAAEARILNSRPDLLSKPQEYLKMVEDEVKKTYPHKFQSSTRNEPMAVAKADTAPISKKTIGYADLPERYKRLYSKVKDHYKIDDFIKELKMTGEL